MKIPDNVQSQFEIAIRRTFANPDSGTIYVFEDGSMKIHSDHIESSRLRHLSKLLASIADIVERPEPSTIKMKPTQ